MTPLPDASGAADAAHAAGLVPPGLPPGPHRPVAAAVVAGWPQQTLTAAVRGYRFWFKPWLGNACRFEPTCSAYALDALALHGAWRGSLLTGRRLLRCHPACQGGIDPVPLPVRFPPSSDRLPPSLPP